jgi:heptosyltransferase II
VTTVLVRLPNHVGDTCMALPALHALTSAGLDCALVGRAWGASLLAGLGAAYQPISGQLLPDRCVVRDFVGRLKSDGDLVGLVLPNSFGSALLFNLVAVPSAGLATGGRRALLRWPVREPHGRHEVERFHAAACGALVAWGRPTVPLPDTLGLRLMPSQRAAADALLLGSRLERYALIAPVATGHHHGRAKHWMHFAALVAPLRERGLQAVAAPPANEAYAVRAALPGATLLPPVDLGVYAALAERAGVVIANDSGSSHVAAAVGARQVTIFGVTDRQRTGPWSPRAICVGADGAWPDMAAVIAAIDEALLRP